MDQATMQRIADRQGVQLTPDNMNRIIQFAAANPDVLERYSMGTAPAQMSAGRDIRGGAGAGGAGDNAALLQLQQPPPSMFRMPSQDVPVEQTQALRQPAPAPQRGPRGTSAVTPPEMMPGWTDYNNPTSPTIGAPPGGGGGSWWDWLLPAILGARAAPRLPPQFMPGRGPEAGGPNRLPTTRGGPEATYVGPMGGDATISGPQQRIEAEGRPRIESQPQAQGRGAGAGRALPQPDPKIENQRNVQTRNSPELERAGADRAVRTGQTAAEIDAENAARSAQEAEQLQTQMRQSEEAARIKRAQQGARDTAKAAASTIRGRR